jgi:hypothetical protein
MRSASNNSGASALGQNALSPGNTAETRRAPFRIDRNGTWYYLGSAIQRPEMVRLFATVLRREGDGYALVTPYERHAVFVEDAPFLAVSMRSEGEGKVRRVMLTTNIGTEVAADGDHPIAIRAGECGDPVPYVALGGGIEAKIGRSVYYALAELAEEGPDGILGVWSAGIFFPLEAIPERGDDA